MSNIDTTLCLSCGADTLRYGFVNRIPDGNTNIDGYRCGTCSGDWAEEVLDKETGEWDTATKWDEVDKYVDNVHIPVVDSIFPDAPAFRKLMESEESWTDEDKNCVQILIDNYRYTYPNQLIISSSNRGDIVELQNLIEAWKNGNASIAMGDEDFEEWQSKGVEIMHGNRTENISIEIKLEESK